MHTCIVNYQEVLRFPSGIRLLKVLGLRIEFLKKEKGKNLRLKEVLGLRNGGGKYIYKLGKNTGE